jgi:multiple sugar transport system substrate-binding protein
MSKKFLKLVALICAMALAFSLAACGTKKEKPADSNATSAETKKDTVKTDVAKTSSKEVEFWSVFTGPDGANMQKMVDEYNKTNPAMKVKHRPILGDDLYAKIPTMVASGKNIPDLCVNHVERLPLFVEKDMLIPLDGY